MDSSKRSSYCQGGTTRFKSKTSMPPLLNISRSFTSPRNYIALIWGLAEATFFFIVPDVWTSGVALKNLKDAYHSCLYALLGALIGGTIIFFIGKETPIFVYNLDAIPGIDNQMIQTVRQELTTQGLASMFLGMFQGIPYKLYASLAYATGNTSYLSFIICSLLARAFRFFTVTTIAGLISIYLSKNIDIKTKQRFHLGFWTLFYIFYFWKMGI